MAQLPSVCHSLVVCENIITYDYNRGINVGFHTVLNETKWGGTYFGCFLSAVFLVKTGVTGHHLENSIDKTEMTQLNLKQNWPRDLHWLKKRNALKMGTITFQ
jgi:hypothetical protein